MDRRLQKRIKELWGKDGVYWVRYLLHSVYVGKSKNIGRRIRDHIEDKTDTGKYLLRNPAAKIHRVSSFESLEVFYIDLFRPSLNKQHNPRRKNRRRRK